MVVFGQTFVYLSMIFIFMLRTRELLKDRQPKRLENVIWASDILIDCSFIEINSANVQELITYLADNCIQLGGVHSYIEQKTVMNLSKYYAKYNMLMHFLLFLIQSGDVHPHPGPGIGENTTLNSGKCKREDTKISLFCMFQGGHSKK